METIPGTQGDSSGLNPSSVKSDDSSPRHGSGRGSPPPNCAICLGTCRNKSFTDSCLHQFCFKCLLTWSKVKAECPLCKQNFKSIIHNVRSNHQYEEYMVGQQETTERIDIDSLTSTRRFRYRTTLTLPRRETIAIQQLLLHYPLVADVLPPPRRRRSPASFRRTVYRHNLWARPLPDFTGRFRDCTPEFYRCNDTQIHRLVPWLNRELYYLLHENVGHISYVMTRIIELLPQFHITSSEFRYAMFRYFGVRTEHFLHELYCFASTPYDMTGYDRNVQYTTDSRISTMVNEVISSSDSEASVDSDIVMLSSSGPTDPPPGPSGVPAPQPATNVIPIETISQSDTDDDSSEVMVVGYIKPPQERTPEIVDLLGSDSDVIVQDAGRSEPTPTEDIADNVQAPLVKLTLKRQRSHDTHDSESDDSTYRPPVRHRRRPRSGDSTTTTDTRHTTPSASPTTSSDPSSSTTSTITSATSSTISPLTSRTTYSTSSSTSSSSSSSTSSSSSSSSSDTDSSSTVDRRKRINRKKTKSKTRNKENGSLKSDRKKNNMRIKRSRRHDHKDSSSPSQPESERRTKRKSHSGKGVKSSKRKEEASIATSSVREPMPERAGPSSSSSRERRKSTKDKKGRPNRENKRLKSVVNVTSSYRSTCESSSSNSMNSCKSSTIPSAGDDRKRKRVDASSQCTSSSNFGSTYSDPEDDLPLNLTVKKPNSLT